MGTPPEDKLANLERLVAELYAARFSSAELEGLLRETQDAAAGKQLRLDAGAARAPRGELRDREKVLKLAWELREFSEKHTRRRAQLEP